MAWTAAHGTLVPCGRDLGTCCRDQVGQTGSTVDVLELARWQFGITTVYHFLMVPLTIGLSLLVAVMQTAWVRTGNAEYCG